MLNKKICLIFILTFFYSFSQEIKNEDKAKVVSVIKNYFNLEREVIHLHLNKTFYINNETIWFKGYIINRKNSKPFFTTNVFILLYDENGKQLSEQLIFASNGSFSGKINLEKKIQSGVYYIQAYTNWMNNFSEDESTYHKINIINPSQGVKNYKKNTNSLAIQINPEGGNYIEGIENNIGITLLDCKNNTVENAEGKVQSMDGDILQTFKLNKFGHGKITIPPTKNRLKIVFNDNNRIIEKEIPTPKEIGIGISVNSHLRETNTLVNLSTNSETLKKLGTKTLYLVINKDSNVIIEEFTLDNQLKKKFIIENKTLFKGINTIRIIDNELNQWCERLIYSDSLIDTNNQITIKKDRIVNNQIKLVGYNAYPNSSISISTLPEKTISLTKNKTDINTGININPYLNKPLEEPSYYFKNRNRIKNIELDLVLLNQNDLKYNWNNMKINQPKSNYSFDIGLSLKGIINKEIKNKSLYKVKLLSYIDLIDKQTDIDEKGGYIIENFAVIDSSYLDISLRQLPDFKKIETILKPQTLNRERPFYKPFKFTHNVNCENVEYEFSALDYPTFSSDIINLKEIIVDKKPKKENLSFENDIGNMNLRGFKIDETYYNQTLLQFIEFNRFTVTRDQGQITISNRIPTSFFGGQSTAEVIINGRRLFTYNELDYMQMSEIDEIYLNRHAIVPGINNKQGLIKIYTKKSTGKEIKTDNFKLFIEKGFSKPTIFKDTDYIDNNNIGYENYGVIGWNPNILSDESGQFLFDISNLNKKNLLIDVEGINTEGKIIQQNLLIE